MTGPIEPCAACGPISYSLEGAEQASGISVAMLRKLISADEIAVVYRGTTPLIKRTELASYIASLPDVRPSARRASA